MKKFWVVVKPSGIPGQVLRHNSMFGTYTEAYEWARKQTETDNKEYAILEAIVSVASARPPVLVTRR